MIQLRSRTIPGIPGVGKERHVVLGGGGYAGYHLGKALAEKGHDVVLFDVRQPDQSLAENMKFVKVFLHHYGMTLKKPTRYPKVMIAEVMTAIFVTQLESSSYSPARRRHGFDVSNIRRKAQSRCRN